MIETREQITGNWQKAPRDWDEDRAIRYAENSGYTIDAVRVDGRIVWPSR